MTARTTYVKTGAPVLMGLIHTDANVKMVSLEHFANLRIWWTYFILRPVLANIMTVNMVHVLCQVTPKITFANAPKDSPVKGVNP